MVSAQLRTAVHGHASHALWDVIRKSRVGYRGEAAKRANRPASWKFFSLCIPIKLIALAWRTLFYPV